ncbi:MAG TPA: alpha/beta fold hydrolase, partial [Thermoanaerobaculia bacterium]|nr:alpha/beta fold hydrolase [Thermoanaerobaculia bacterium]
MSDSFELTSEEGLIIRGDLAVPDRPRALVVLVHGFKGFKDWGFFPWLSEHLCRHRAVVCRFNMSRSGIGENPETFDRLDLFEGDTYSAQVSDLRKVVEHAQSRHRSLPVFLVGHSRGGGVALLAAKHIPKLSGVATWSAISRVDRWSEEDMREWRERGYREEVNSRTKQVMRMSTAILDDAPRHDVLGSAADLEVPLLVVHGARDESVSSAEAHAIAATRHDANLVIIGKASHTYNAIHPLVHVPHELSMAAEITAHFIAAY